MKKCIFSLFLLLLLIGCGAPAPAEPGVPPEEPTAVSEAGFLSALTPLGELSTPAEVTEGRELAENYSLPQALYLNPIMDDSFPVLVAEAEDAAFYGLQWDKALIRWGDGRAEFDWPWLTPQQILPRLYCFDLDNDWQDELIVVCHPGTGTGISVDELHVLEKGQDGTLTDYALPWEFFSEDMSKALSVETVNGRTYSILGTELTDITGLLPEDADPENIDGLSAGDIINFEIVPEPRFYGEDLRYRGSAWLRGEGFPGALCYVAEIEAVISYQDGVFTMTQIHLS